MERGSMRIIVLLQVFLISCATINGPEKYPVFVESETPNIMILFLCNQNARMQWNPVYEQRNKTKSNPTVFFQKANEICKVRVESVGHEAEEVDVERYINPTFIFTLFPMGLLLFPVLVDFISGHWKKPDSRLLKIQLKSVKKSEPQNVEKYKLYDKSNK